MGATCLRPKAVMTKPRLSRHLSSSVRTVSKRRPHDINYCKTSAHVRLPPRPSGQLTSGDLSYSADVWRAEGDSDSVSGTRSHFTELVQQLPLPTQNNLARLLHRFLFTYTPASNMSGMEQRAGQSLANQGEHHDRWFAGSAC